MMSQMVALNLWQLEKMFKTRVQAAVQAKLEKGSNHSSRQPLLKKAAPSDEIQELYKKVFLKKPASVSNSPPIFWGFVL